MSSSGRIIGQGNLVEAKAMLKKAGKAMAASQSIVFHLSSFVFSACLISFVFLGGCWCDSLEKRANGQVVGH